MRNEFLDDGYSNLRPFEHLCYNVAAMLIYKAFRYRLYPTANQQQALAIQFGHARFVWNWALELRKSTYEKTGKGIGFYELKRRLTELKHQPETKWLNEAGSQALQAKLEDLERAFQKFYTKQARYPHFKTKKSNQSVRYPQRFKLSDQAIYLPKVGWVKAVLHRPLQGKARNLTGVENQEREVFCICTMRSGNGPTTNQKW